MNQGMGAVIDKRGIVRGLLNPLPAHQSFEEKQRQQLAEFHARQSCTQRQGHHGKSLRSWSSRATDGVPQPERSFGTSATADETLLLSSSYGNDGESGVPSAEDVSMEVDNPASAQVVFESQFSGGRSLAQRREREVSAVSQAAEHSAHQTSCGGGCSSTASSSGFQEAAWLNSATEKHPTLSPAALQSLPRWATCPRCLRSWCTASWASCARGFTALECVWMNSHDLRWEEEMQANTRPTQTVRGQQPRRKVLELMMTRRLGADDAGDETGCECCCSSFLFVTDVLWWSDCMLGQAETMCRHFFLKSR